jgi:hypothetical protein
VRVQQHVAGSDIRPMTGESASALLHDLGERGVAAVLSSFAPESIRLPAGSLGRLTMSCGPNRDPGRGLANRRLVCGRSSWTTRAGCVRRARRQDGAAAARVGTRRDRHRRRPPAGRVRLLQSRLRALGRAGACPCADAAASLPFADTFDRVLPRCPLLGLGHAPPRSRSEVDPDARTTSRALPRHRCA